MSSSHASIDRLATLGSLAGNVGHELNNATQLLMGAIELLRRHKRKGLVAEDADLELLDLAASHFAKHAAQLASISRLGSRNVERFDAREVIEATLAKLRGMGRTKHIVVKCDLGERPLLVAMSRVSLEQIIMNLVINAADAIGGVGASKVSGGMVSVTAMRADGAFRVTVSDDGPGMNDAVKASVLAEEPYFTTKPAGTGLGLPVVRELAGTLSVESEAGKGTSVSFVLPALV